MREQKFRNWLENVYKKQDGKPLKQRSKDTYVKDCRKIEAGDGYNLDKEFETDQMQNLLERYTYSGEDEEMGRKNPTNLDIETHRLYKTLGNYKVVMNRYREFREQTD